MLGWKGELRLVEMVRYRLKRYRDRTGKQLPEQNTRLAWYELGFRDGWVAGVKAVEESDEKGRR